MSETQFSIFSKLAMKETFGIMTENIEQIYFNSQIVIPWHEIK